VENIYYINFNLFVCVQKQHMPRVVRCIKHVRYYDFCWVCLLIGSVRHTAGAKHGTIAVNLISLHGC